MHHNKKRAIQQLTMPSIKKSRDKKVNEFNLQERKSKNSKTSQILIFEFVTHMTDLDADAHSYNTNTSIDYLHTHTYPTNTDISTYMYVYTPTVGYLSEYLHTCTCTYLSDWQVAGLPVKVREHHWKISPPLFISLHRRQSIQ